MACSRDGVFAFALAVMALTLAGCGSGGSPSLRPAAPITPADLVSQSVEGIMEGTQSINGSKPVSIPSELFALFIDADGMNFRVESSGSATVGNITAHSQVKAIVNVTQKRITYFLNMTVDGEPPIVNCLHFPVKQMPDAKTLKQLISSVLKSQPVTKADDGNRQILLKFDLSKMTPGVKGRANETVELREDNVLAKVTASVDMTNPINNSVQSLLTATKMSAGAPDASKFAVDKSWGICTEKPPAALYEDFSPVHFKVFQDLNFFLSALEIQFQTLIETKIETETMPFKQSEVIAI